MLSCFESSVDCWCKFRIGVLLAGALNRHSKDGGSMTFKIAQEISSPVPSEAVPGIFGGPFACKEAYQEPSASRELQLKIISLQQELHAQQQLVKILQQCIRCSQEEISNNSPEDAVTDLQCPEKLQKQQRQICDLTACLAISEQQKEQLVLEVSAQRKEVVNLKETVSALREMTQAKNSANIQLAKELHQLKEQLKHHQPGFSCTLPTFMLEIKRELKFSKSKMDFLSGEVNAQENLRLESERREKELLDKYNDMVECYERLEQRLVVTLQWLRAADAAWQGPTLEFLAKACPLSCYDAHGFRVPLELEKQPSGPSRAQLLQELVGNIQNDPDDFVKVQQSKWTALFVSGELSPSTEVKHLVRSGVPPAYRPRLWRWFVNRHVGSERTAAPKEYYNLLLQEMAGQPNPAAHLVEIDLMRTLPGHQRFASPDSPDICKLRRVLLAFSWRNPDIGYCQGLNRLAAISLLYLDEEEVFWCLVAIVEKIMPKDYYGKNLLASQADQRVLKDMLEDKLPRLHTHLLQQNVDLSLITINWFLVLFVDSLSTDILLRVWDSILYEGCKVIFRFALALFKYKEEEILKLQDSSTIFNYSSCFPRMILDFKKLSHLAFRELNPIRSRTLMQLRATHMARLKEELGEFERLQQDMLSWRDRDKTLKAP
uniref:TBC1 domain family member 2B-like n=1 Tax=Myxine glutinosa TaxID=7769 RepID=UPI00358FF58E